MVKVIELGNARVNHLLSYCWLIIDQTTSSYKPVCRMEFMPTHVDPIAMCQSGCVVGALFIVNLCCLPGRKATLSGSMRW